LPQPGRRAAIRSAGTRAQQPVDIKNLYLTALIEFGKQAGSDDGSR